MSTSVLVSGRVPGCSNCFSLREAVGAHDGSAHTLIMLNETQDALMLPLLSNKVLRASCKPPSLGKIGNAEKKARDA